MSQSESLQCVQKCRSPLVQVVIFLKNGREVIFWDWFLIFEKANKNKNDVCGCTDFVVFDIFWGEGNDTFERTVQLTV